MNLDYVQIDIELVFMSWITTCARISFHEISWLCARGMLNLHFIKVYSVQLQCVQLFIIAPLSFSSSVLHYTLLIHKVIRTVFIFQRLKRPLSSYKEARNIRPFKSSTVRCETELRKSKWKPWQYLYNAVENIKEAESPETELVTPRLNENDQVM